MQLDELERGMQKLAERVDVALAEDPDAEVVISALVTTLCRAMAQVFGKNKGREFHRKMGNLMHGMGCGLRGTPGS
jgi:hypothetical protein